MKRHPYLFWGATLFFLLFYQTTSAAGLVPCDANCNLCYLLIGISNIFQWLTGSLLMVAFLSGIAVAGILYIVSGAFPKALNLAKQTLQNSFKGFVLAMSCWLIVNSVMNIVGYKHPAGGKWWQHECSTSATDKSENVRGDEKCEAKNKILESVKIQCAAGSGEYISLETTSDSENKENKADKYQLTALGKYSCKKNDGSNEESEEDITQKATWKASDETQIKVSGGLVQAVTKGSVSEDPPYVEASYDGKNSNAMRVYVNSCPATDYSKKSDKAENFVAGKIVENAMAQNEEYSDNLIITPADEATAQKGWWPGWFGEGSPPPSKRRCNKACPDDPKHTCHYLEGSYRADNIFVLMRRNDSPGGAGSKHNCATKLEQWREGNTDDLNLFENKAKDFAKGYRYLNDAKGQFAVYESTLIGASDPTCPAGKKYTGYGYVYKGTGNRAAGGSMGAQYCIDIDAPSQIFAHEQPGHIFALLQDEYVNTKLNPNLFYHRPNRNCTADPACAKWGPKKESCELGCLYAEYSLKVSDSSRVGVYRSSKNSLMRSHLLSSGFDTLNSWIIQYKADNGYLPTSVNPGGQPPLQEYFPAVKWP